jgi:hypothetical protein
MKKQNFVENADFETSLSSPRSSNSVHGSELMRLRQRFAAMSGCALRIWYKRLRSKPDSDFSISSPPDLQKKKLAVAKPSGLAHILRCWMVSSCDDMYFISVDFPLPGY